MLKMFAKSAQYTVFRYRSFSKVSGSGGVAPDPPRVGPPPPSFIAADANVLHLPIPNTAGTHDQK